MVLFQLSGRGHLYDDATPNFNFDYSSYILGLLNEISFVSELFLEGGSNSQNVWMKITKKTKVEKDSRTNIKGITVY